MPDKIWDDYKFGNPKNRFSNKKWIAYCLAISNFGKSLLNCEIDFQITKESYNEIHKSDIRLNLTEEFGDK